MRTQPCLSRTLGPTSWSQQLQCPHPSVCVWFRSSISLSLFSTQASPFTQEDSSPWSFDQLHTLYTFSPLVDELMATPSMQVCMETSDWLKGIVSDDAAAAASIDNSNSSTPPATEILPVRPSPTMLERRLRPPHDQALKCPRCDSTHTKFCYYNNYSLSQPRYFCKTCRRYWTKGGSLRSNVPVGGRCRKNKRSSSSAAAKKPAEWQQSIIHHHHSPHQPTDLQLSNLNFKFEGSGQLFMDNVGSGYANSLGFSIDGGHDSFAEACQRLALPFGAAQEEEGEVEELKPVNRMLSLEWPDQGCGDSYGLWAGMISGHAHGHGPSSSAM